MKSNVKSMTISGLFAALVFVLTYFVKVPVASGYVHLGDAMIYLCACFVGGPWAIFASCIGAVLADVVSGYAMYAPATLVVKGLIALVFVLLAKGEKIVSVKSIIACVISAGITIGGYFVADLIIDKTYAVIDIPGNAIQALGSAILFVVIGVAFDKAKLKQKLVNKKL